jgi:hypothetical protein
MTRCVPGAFDGAKPYNIKSPFFIVGGRKNTYNRKKKTIEADFHYVRWNHSSEFDLSELAQCYNTPEPARRAPVLTVVPTPGPIDETWKDGLCGQFFEAYRHETYQFIGCDEAVMREGVTRICNHYGRIFNRTEPQVTASIECTIRFLQGCGDGGSGGWTDEDRQKRWEGHVSEIKLLSEHESITYKAAEKRKNRKRRTYMIDGDIKCDICQTEFRPKRKDARTCSAKCRKALSRLNKKKKTNP